MEPVAGPSSVRGRESARRRTKGAGQVLTYDELIEGERDVSVAFRDDLEFRFEIPEEIEGIKLAE